MPPQSNKPTRGEGLCLLSLDAGGPRAISQLNILASLMDRLNSEGSGHEQKRPCEVFDMIGGTGTGGFIAIMLAIFRMNVNEALEEFVELSSKILELKGTPAEARTNLLQKHVEELMERHQMGKESKLLHSNDHSRGCKLVVPISYKKHVGASLTLRNFDVRQDPSLNLTITKALLATLATPPLFTSISISKDASIFEYISGDAKFGNPTRKIVAEALATFGSESLVACILNLGCGHPGIISTPDDANSAEWNRYLEKLVKDSEQTVQELEVQMGHSGLFQRLSVTIGLEEAEDKAAPDLSEFITQTKVYLNDGAVVEKVDTCVESLKTRLGISSLEQINYTGGITYVSPSLPPLTEAFVMRKKPWEFIDKVLNSPEGGGSRMLIVTGMGGCGKTQLVLSYITQHSNRYSLRLFIDGSSEARIRSEVVRHIRSLGTEHSQKTFGECLDYLSHPSPAGPRVIVYDNVDDPNTDLLSLLPKGTGCEIVITSRNYSIGELRSDSHLRLDVMSKEEAVELLLKPPAHSQLLEEQAYEISEQLGHLPIALMQARSYMYQTQCSGTEYLETLRENQAELLAEPVKYKRDMRYLSTDAAFAASFGQLMERTQHFILLLSNFHRNNFPLGLVVIAARYHFAEYETKYIEHGDEYHAGRAVLERIFLQNGRWSLLAFNKMIILLQNYSLITIIPGVDNRLVQMHSLVHNWVKSRIPKDMELQYQSAAIHLLALGGRKEHMPLVQYLPIHITHFILVWDRLHINHAGAFGVILGNGGIFEGALLLLERVVTELRGRDDISEQMLADSISRLAVTYQKMGQFEKAKILEEEVLRLRTKSLGERHSDTISSSSTLAMIYRDLGRHEEARILGEEVLRLFQEVQGARHPDTIVASNNLASTYADLRRHEEARLLREEGLRLGIEVLGKRHPDTVIASNNLAITYGDLGRHKEAQVLNEEVLQFRKEALGERHPSTIAASNNLANTYRALGRHEEARVLNEKVLQLFQEVLGQRHPSTITASNNLATTYTDLGRYEEARVLMEEVIRLRKEVLGERHPDTIAASANLANTYADLGRHEEARLLREEVLRLSNEVLGACHLDTVIASTNLASTYRALARHEQARVLSEEVLRSFQKVLGERHPTTITASNNLALTYRDLGRYEEARMLNEEVFRLRKEVLGERHPDTIGASNNLAGTYADLGRHEEARVLREDVLRSSQETLGKRHPSTITASHNLASTYRVLGRHEQARVLKEEVLRLFQEVLGERHPTTIVASNSLAITYRDLGRYEEARVCYEQVLRLRKEVQGEHHPDTIIALDDLADTYTYLGRDEEARVLMEEVLRLRKEVFGKHHPSTMNTSSSLAILYIDLGRNEEARVLLEEVLRFSQEVLGERHLNTINTSNNLAIVCKMLGRREEVRVLQEKILRLRKEVQGERHPDTIVASNNLASTCRDLGRHEEARMLEEITRLRMGSITTHLPY